MVRWYLTRRGAVRFVVGDDLSHSRNLSDTHVLCDDP